MAAALLLLALAAGDPARTIPNPTLIAQDGSPVRLRELLAGRVAVVSFAYTRCQGVCPATFAALRRLQAALGDRLGREVVLVTLSLDPANDTPEAWRDRAAALGARPGWWFLGGRPGDLEALRRHLGFTDPDPAVDGDRSQHSAMLAIGNDRTGSWTSVPAGMRFGLLAEAVWRTGRLSGAPPG